MSTIKNVPLDHGMSIITKDEIQALWGEVQKARDIVGQFNDAALTEADLVLEDIQTSLSVLENRGKQ